MTATQQRYQPGGDIYAKLLLQYGRDAANKMAAAAASPDPYDENEVMAEIRNGPRLNDSTASLFFERVTTDPLAAPLESANNHIGNAVLGVLKNPWVLFAIVVFAFYQLGGFNWLRKQLA